VAAQTGASTARQRPWGYLFWQLNDVMQGSSWGSLGYGGRFKLAHYAARRWFAPVRVECNLLAGPPVTALSAAAAPADTTGSPQTNCTLVPNQDYGDPGRPGVPAATVSWGWFVPAVGPTILPKDRSILPLVDLSLYFSVRPFWHAGHTIDSRGAFEMDHRKARSPRFWNCFPSSISW